MCTGVRQLICSELFQLIAGYKLVSHTRWFLEDLTLLWLFLSMYVNHLRKIEGKLRPRKILWAPSVNFTFQHLYAFIHTRENAQNGFSSIEDDGSCIAGKICLYLIFLFMSHSGHGMVWQQLQWALFYWKTAGRKYWQLGWVKEWSKSFQMKAVCHVLQPFPGVKCTKSSC